MRSALVLAGRRGPDDPMADARGVSHRALLPVCGVPMLQRVVRALREAGIAHVHVSIDRPELLRGEAWLSELESRGAVQIHAAASSPSQSVLDVLSQQAEEPFLVTTADHALLTPEMVRHFAWAAEESGADLVIGFVAASLLRRAYPESTRTWLRMRDESWSGANLFAFRTAASREAARFWVRAEHLRKQPWRLVAALGPGLLLGYLTRRLDLDAALSRASRRIGATVRAVPMPMPEAAIDVDRESDLALATRILGERSRAKDQPAG